MDNDDSTKHRQQQLRAGLAIERLCDQLEAGLRETGSPTIEELLSKCPAVLIDNARKALIIREIEVRGELGDANSVTNLLSRFPEEQSLIRKTASPQPPSEVRDAKKSSTAPFSALQIQELAKSWAKQPDKQAALKVAREHVKAGRLTKYQAEEMLNGRSKLLTFGSYLVLAKIGQGGMGMVLRGEHQEMKRPVAIKVLTRAARKQADAVLRFRREVEAAARLLHPNIVTAYDAGEHEGMLYLVMEFVPGSDLHGYVRDHGPLKVDDAIHCLLEAARGLEYAHQLSVVHRDIKPANLLLAMGPGSGASNLKAGNAPCDTAKALEVQRCRVKVLDMGLARIDVESIANAMSGQTPAESPLTATGEIMGTVDYMSPEQAVDTRSVDGRADIYALGCTLHYLLTGNPPFSGDNLMQRLMAHRAQPIPSLRKTRPDVPVSLEDVFQGMLAKRPEDRVSTMSEVITLLEDCLLELRPDAQRPASSKRPPVRQAVEKVDELTELPSIRVRSNVDEDDFEESATERRSGVLIGFKALLLGTFLTLVVVIGWVIWDRFKPPEPDLTQVRFEDRSAKTPSEDLPGTIETTTQPATVPVRHRWTPAEALEWALGQGSARVQVGDQILDLERGQKAPVETYTIITLNIAGSKGEIDGNVSRLSGLTSLRELDLSATELTDAGIAALVSLPRLESLDVSGCQIGAAGLKSIGQIGTLVSLSVGQTADAPSRAITGGSGNGDQVLLDDLQGLSRLTSLEIGGGYSEQAVLSLLSKCSGLVSLKVDSVPFTSNGIASLGALKNLTTLSLTNAELTEGDVSSLMTLRGSVRLTELNIQGNAITRDGVHRLMDEFAGCKIFGGGFDPKRNLVREIVQKKGTVFVTAAGQSGLEISEANFNDLPETFNLLKVNLSGVRPLPPHLLSLKEVTELNLADSAVSGRSILELPGYAPSVTILNLSGTVVTDAEIKVLANMETLQQVDVSRTRVTQSGIEQFRVERPRCKISGP